MEQGDVGLQSNEAAGQWGRGARGHEADEQGGSGAVEQGSIGAVEQGGGDVVEKGGQWINRAVGNGYWGCETGYSGVAEKRDSVKST